MTYTIEHIAIGNAFTDFEGLVLASADKDGTIALYDLDTCEMVMVSGWQAEYCDVLDEDYETTPELAQRIANYQQHIDDTE